MTAIPSFSAFAIPDIPLIQRGDNLVEIILNRLEKASMSLQAGDVLVVSSKIVSKSEGQTVFLNTVIPGEQAQTLAQETGKDPRIAELVLQDSKSVSRKTRGVLVVVHRLGFVSANAGIDQSNLGQEDAVLLLPRDPDASARQIRQAIQARLNLEVGIIISDTHGRPFRIGNVGVAIGVAGMPAIVDLRGRKDLFGRTLEISVQGYADMVASAAHLLCGEADEGYPVIVLRGLDYPARDGKASDLHRPPEQDLYR